MIGIISAMHEEMQTLLESLQEPITITKGMRTYHKGTLFNTDVILVFSRWGKVASATTVTQLINDHDIDEIIFTGVAGSISKNLNILKFKKWFFHMVPILRSNSFYFKSYSYLVLDVFIFPPQ